MKFHLIALPGVLALICTWSLAAVVLSTGPGQRRDRLLALLLVLEGAAWATGSGFLYLFEDPAVSWYLQAAFIGAMIAIPVCTLGFAGTLPTPLMAPLRARGVLPALAAITVAAELYFLTHVHGFVGAIVPAWYATWDLMLPPITLNFFNLVGIVGVVSLVGAISAWMYSPRGSWARRQARFFAIAFAVHDIGMFMALVAPGHLVPPPPSGHLSDVVIIVGIDCTSIAFAVLLAYGILKVQLFDIDLRIKRGIRRSAVAAVFVAVFLIVEQVMQNYLSAHFGLLLGAVAAGLTLFALGPIRHFAEGVANGAMPSVSATPEYLSYRKLGVYRAAFEDLYSDAGISDKERTMLDHLRIKLEIGPDDARAIENEVRGERRFQPA